MLFALWAATWMAVTQLQPARPPAAAIPATPVRPPAPAGLSWDDADQVQRIVARIERRLRVGKSAADGPIVVTERQLNSYVNLTLGWALPPGITGLQLRLARDRLGAEARVDLDRIKGRLPPGALSGLLSLLSGTVPVEAQGRLVAVNGTGRVEIEQATIGGLSLPASLVAQIVSASTKSAQQPQGVDIRQPFPLPWTARDVHLEPGRALVVFFAR